MNYPSEEVQRRVLDRILQAGGIEPAARVVLRFLFERTIEAARTGLSPKAVTIKEIFKECQKLGGCGSESTTRNAVSDLRYILKEFTPTNESGKPAAFLVEIDERAPVLRFVRRKVSGAGIRRFWESYFTSFATSGLYYSAPQFFRHRSGSYLRYPRANWREQQALVAEVLNLKKQDLRQNYSFIASGMTTAVIRLMGCFYHDDVALKAAPVQPTHEEIPWEHETIVVLASPTAGMGVTTRMEEDMPYRTRRDDKTGTSFCRNGEHSYVDGNAEDHFDRDAVPEKKYVLLTRRIEERREGDGESYPQRRIVTLLSGHSRAIQAATEMLTSEEKIREVLQKFPGAIPAQFQIVFEVQFETDGGDLILKKSKVARVVPIQSSDPRARQARAKAHEERKRGKSG
jgi:hypothetical protein